MLSAFFVSLAIMATAAIPMVVATRRHGSERRRQLFRNHLIAIAVIALTCAIVADDQGQLTGQCRAAGNSQCVDYGGSGMQVSLIVGYSLVALIRAWQVHNDPVAQRR